MNDPVLPPPDPLTVLLTEMGEMTLAHCTTVPLLFVITTGPRMIHPI